MLFIFYLALQIILLFGLAFVFTWVNEIVAKTGIFGDTYTGKINDSAIKDGIDWGARHYYYFWCCVILWIVSLIRIIMWADWYWLSAYGRQLAQQN